MIDERQKSEFSGDVSYLNRLNYYFFLAGMAAIDLDAYGWYHTLRVLFRELSTEMKPEEITKWNTKAKGINNKLSKQLEDNLNSGNVEISPELYEGLNEYELFIRSILKDSGLQNRMKEGAGTALG